MGSDTQVELPFICNTRITHGKSRFQFAALALICLFIVLVKNVEAIVFYYL